jgi:glycosyltransferase involved in cell wall biosynthesis
MEKAKTRIGILTYPYYSFPPKKYGPMQVVTSEIAEELTKRGYDVTAFATGDSKLSCKIIPVKETGVIDDPTVPGPKIYEFLTYEKLLEHRNDFDVLSSHITFHILPFVEFLNYPVVINLQSDYSNPHFKKIFYTHKDYYYVSLYDGQRKFLPELNYVATIHHGIKVEDFIYSQEPQDQFAFLGRTSPVKGLDVAIEVAKKAQVKLLIGARSDPTLEAEDFYKKKIKPQLDNKQIVWLGELGQKEKIELLKDSKALIFPIKWEEAFGLVMIEAMACGTPVIAYDRGAVSEVVEDGKTGFICPADDKDALTRAIKKIDQMPEEEYIQMRKNCRKRIEENFSLEKMVDGYEKVYQKVIDDWRKKHEK